MARVGRWLLAIMVLVCIAGGAFYLGHSTAPGAKQAASVALFRHLTRGNVKFHIRRRRRPRSILGVCHR
jgi:hypothetical protein